MGPTTQKVLLLLFGGLTLGLTTSPTQYFRVVKIIGRAWKEIDKRSLHKAIKNLYTHKLIDAEDNEDGTTTIVLTSDGKTKALTYQIDEIRVPAMKKWDKKWRIVLFDIPERRRGARKAIARALLNAGFYQFQKSVFVHPFECQNEVDFIIEFFSLRPHVRIITAERVDNEPHLKKVFGLV